MSGLFGFVAALSLVAFIIFAGVGIHELNYASAHPHAYGPAKVIAWGAGGGALVAASVGILAVALGRQRSYGPTP